MKTTKVSIGVIANCQDCDWKSEDYRIGEEMARRHAQAKGHRILAEVTKLVEIEGRKENV